MLAGYDYDKPVDIFAVGFEEIVDLNASNIMKARWESVKDFVNTLQSGVHTMLAGCVTADAMQSASISFIRMWVATLCGMLKQRSIIY